MDKLEALRKYYGHTAFRTGQEALIDGLLSRRDVFGVMPTGGGKSVCYQIPALLLPGTALVLSPLISLMKDQVMALQQAGVPAAFLNSSLSPEESRAVYRRAWAGELKLLYVAPERLESEGFQRLTQSLELSLVAVDEAHCVSQWGQDFRPHYLRIAPFLSSLPRRPPVGAFTATATGAVREDVRRLLDLRDPLELVTGFDRPNLFFDVLRPKSKSKALLSLLSQRRGKSGIIYCATRREVEKLCALLREEGFPATRYHAGLEEDERKANQDDFRFDRFPIMVATNAFGMGIDKSNVSFVIHYNMPKSLEAYYQEAGRAGRDGEPAECILLFGPADPVTARYLIEHGRDNDALEPQERAEAIQRDYRRLKEMERYCKSTDCLRGWLLDYFGQDHPPRCGNCGPCRSSLQQVDITRQAQMILSCVVRAGDLLGYRVGGSLIVQVLRGGRGQRLLDKGLDRLSTYGLMKDVGARQIREYVEALLDQGYLAKDPEYGGLSLTAAARPVLFQGAAVTVLRREVPEDFSEEAPAAPAQASAPPPDGLFEALKALRLRLAQREKIPPFMVFSNATLTDMAAKRPHNLAQLLRVSGVGEKKAERYGVPFLLTIQEFEEENASHPDP